MFIFTLLNFYYCPFQNKRRAGIFGITFDRNKIEICGSHYPKQEMKLHRITYHIYDKLTIHQIDLVEETRSKKRYKDVKILPYIPRNLGYNLV